MSNGTAMRNIVVSLVFALSAGPAWAESLSPQDREEINRLRTAQGHSPEDINPLLEQVNKAGERGLPVELLANKVKEGLAKGIEPKRIDPVLRQMTSRLESAHEVLEEAKGRGMAEGSRQRALETMAEAFARGATVDEVRELSRLSQEGRHKATQEELAAGAKSLAVMKEGRIPSKDGTVLVGEGIKQGYRSSELLDLGREVKRRGSDFEEGRASLQTLRDKVSKGERSNRLFRDDHSGSGDDRDRGERSDRGGKGSRNDSDRDRSDRHEQSGSRDRSDRIDRPDKVDRVERPDRPDSRDRPERSDRSGRGRD
ncbi:MAG: hypothetical protein OEV27_05000 [Nitrospira sp.]|nr:hypothetical protein [Nitrospira sp.]MDH4250529.1 hypothetical protein [Nitrospira sp.]MDH4341880.1 hypothetical protein [Nitrospira sp.]MDH5336947.1 hypothetical protein [Nitrospira sp.]